MSILLPGFGLYRQDNLVFLHEQDGGRCLTPGLEELDSPFKVAGGQRRRCPHQLGEFLQGEIPDDPIVRAMNPAPSDEPGFYWIEPAKLSALLPAAQHMIQRMEEPSVYRGSELRLVRNHLNLTNCLPIIVVNYSAAQWQDMSFLAQMARTRTLIISGWLKVPEAQDITPDVIVKRTPEEWRQIASAQLHQWLEGVLYDD